MAQNRRLGRRGCAAGKQLHRDAFALARIHARLGGGLRSGDKGLTRQHCVARRGRQPLDPLNIANHERWLNSRQQSGKVGIGEAVVERTIRHPRQRRTKQGDRRGLTADVEQHHLLCAAFTDQVRRARGRRPNLGIGPVPSIASQANAVGLCARRHIQK